MAKAGFSFWTEMFEEFLYPLFHYSKLFENVYGGQMGVKTFSWLFEVFTTLVKLI